MYLSPHLDDGVWSCGGQIAQQTSQGKTGLVVSVFTADPSGPLPDTELVREARRSTGSVTMAARRLEDMAAMQALGAQAVHLGLVECLYRLDAHSGQWMYTHPAHLLGALALGDEETIDKLVQRFQTLPPLTGAIVYAPLAVGGHVDHQLVRIAAEEWGAPGGQLAYYEDYPYAEHPGALEGALAQFQYINLQPRLVPLSPADMDNKIQAALCYESQIPMFFQDEEGAINRFLTFACTRADDIDLAERVWSASFE